MRPTRHLRDRLSSNATHLQEHRLSWLRPTLLPALVALIVLVAGGVALDRQTNVLDEERARAVVLAQVSLIRAKLEGNINGNIQLVRGLVSTISTEPRMDQDRFAALVSNLFEEQSQLRLVAGAPDLVVRMTYPFAGNERAIGLDYRKSPAQRDAVLRARDTGKLVLAGPVDLVQGGRGFVGRFPVFVDTPAGRTFWGVVSAVVDVERLYADSGLTDRSLTIDISITGKDATGGDGTRFFGPDLSAQNPVTASVILPSGSWEIAAIPRGGWTATPGSFWRRAAMVAAVALILLPIVITGRLMGERQQHFRELKSREAELERLSRRLGLALDVSKVGVWEMDMTSGRETWDDRTNELYGLPNDGGARSHDHWKAAVHPDDQEKAENDFRRTIASGRYESMYRVLLPDNTVRHVRSVGALYREPGVPDKVVGVNWDVTADVALNEDLRRATQLTEARNQELEAARIRIEHNALHDSLTGLPNRRYLDEMLNRHAASGYEGTGSIALLHIDLDRFKQINDTMGHAAGDAMLIHASGVLRRNCGDTDFVARVGGDEFVVLTTASDGDIYLGTLAERIVREMRQPVVYEGHQCRFGVSIGIAADWQAVLDVKRLLINADIALYRAKGRGRNRFEFFSETLQAEVVRTKRIADEILGGLERTEFVAWFQPQFDAKTLDVVGVEALARWQHPTEGIKTPDAFLQVAEELNVVATVDRLILEQSLAALSRWDAMGLGVPRASVNVSLRRLNDEDLIKGLRELDIEPGRISFELVESIYLDEGDAIVGWNIDEIKKLGIDVEIDDFGTGYASIVSLQKLRPKRLKIDRQLVNPILVDPAQRRLLASIVDIGKSMGIEVVAEGVETMAHAAILRDLGCDILQGYAFSRPLSAADFETFLVTKAWRKAS
ncbi:MAG: EAL domain-containing protein [Alphaproteobacteria bacterium]|nr:EAL domain-containing protein [Alphaproteobacteria bacterium]MBU1562565.1 EAL domain-containing protein [Alphaproteobacteria bacterium]MBU2303970.1 EAL domain-containing protein [Alphaproteobacteria bacterium]MBU2369033.1 EAL domain-containing protein [Alphaproteobacteria bacterium]